ncbi:MAG TPA: PAS domain-containing protein [Spirochaetia bacterium]|nr:PAS domain-containing protein [Spirochaetia bacterium]
MDGSWVENFPRSIMVCDREGKILEMNEKACTVFQKDGGRELTGRNVLDCHPGAAREKLKGMLDNQTFNCYTTEKDGVKKLIYQTPWYKDNEYMGFVELSLEIPFEMPHFVRKSTNP